MPGMKAAILARESLQRVLASTAAGSATAGATFRHSFNRAAPFVKENTEFLTALSATAAALVAVTTYTVKWREQCGVKLAEQNAKFAEQSKAEGIAMAALHVKFLEQSKADGIAIAALRVKFLEQSKADGIAIAALQTIIAEKDGEHATALAKMDGQHGAALAKMDKILSDISGEHAVAIAKLEARSRWW